MYKFAFFISLLILCSITRAASNDIEENSRVLKTFVNPDCNIDSCKKFNNATTDLSIVHIVSSKYKDNTTKHGPDLHFILSTFNGTPAFFIVSTPNDSSLNIDWQGLVGKKVGSIKFMQNGTEVHPKNTIGVLIDKMFMWLDSQNASAVYIPGTSKEVSFDPSSLTWHNVTILEATKDKVHVEFAMKKRFLDGLITLRLMLTSSNEKYDDLPHLLFTSKSIHTRLQFDGFKEVFPLNTTTRLGLQFTVVSAGQSQGMKAFDSFDDENSPGLFSTLIYPFGQYVANSSFLSFKPNAYTTNQRLIAQTVDSQQSQIQELKKPDDIFKRNNAFYSFYGTGALNAYQLYLTFGSDGQEFFSKTNYTEFNFVFGLGDLPTPELSLFIQLVIIIGSGLSLLVLLIFPITICLMARKMKNRRNEALLNNEDSIY